MEEPQKEKQSIKKKKEIIKEVNESPSSMNMPIPINMNLNTKGSTNPVNKLINLTKRMPAKVNDSSLSNDSKSNEGDNDSNINNNNNYDNDNDSNEINNGFITNEKNKFSDSIINDTDNEVNDIIEENIDKCIEESDMKVVDDAFPPTTNEIFNKFNLSEDEITKQYKG